MSNKNQSTKVFFLSIWKFKTVTFIICTYSCYISAYIWAVICLSHTHTCKGHYCLRDFIFYRNLQKLTLLLIFKRFPKSYFFERYWKDTHTHAHTQFFFLSFTHLFSQNTPLPLQFPGQQYDKLIQEKQKKKRKTWRFFCWHKKKKNY